MLATQELVHYDNVMMKTRLKGIERPAKLGRVAPAERVPGKHGALFCLDSRSVPAELFSFPLRNSSQLINGAPGSSGWELIHPECMDSSRAAPLTDAS